VQNVLAMLFIMLAMPLAAIIARVPSLGCLNASAMEPLLFVLWPELRVIGKMPKGIHERQVGNAIVGAVVVDVMDVKPIRDRPMMPFPDDAM
jgi:hypothetical protein